MIYWSTGSGRIEIAFASREDAESAAHQGQCDEDVRALSLRADIRKQLDALDPATVVDELVEYGAWEADALADHEQNLQRLLWLAAGDIADDMEGERYPDEPLGECLPCEQGKELHRDDVGLVACRYCGSKTCDFSCDESQADGFETDNMPFTFQVTILENVDNVSEAEIRQALDGFELEFDVSTEQSESPVKVLLRIPCTCGQEGNRGCEHLDDEDS